MNRIVLIGNGFDLAHGMQTSYASFIKWYLTQAIIKAKTSNYEDKLLSIRPNLDYRVNRLSISDEQIKHSVDQSYERGLNLNTIGPAVQSWDGVSFSYPYLIKCVSPISENLVKHCKVYRWVDVETIFYETLTGILDNPRPNRSEKERLLESLNQSMAELISNLRAYLLSLPTPEPIEGYRKIFKEAIRKDELDSSKRKSSPGHYTSNEAPTKTMLLNFNYTPTLERYFDIPMSGASNVNINYIHGQLADESNAMVFGFGDELDKKYQLMEEEKSKGWFTYIKSFWYFKTSKYRELVRFVDSGDYQVVILGHSCGLSDRTMLHMLLEHEYCRSIKIYYHEDEKTGIDNYTETTYELARHFNNKSTMRKRIVERISSQKMPQA